RKMIMKIEFRSRLISAIATGIVAGMHFSVSRGDVPEGQVRHPQEEAIEKGTQPYKSEEVSFENVRAHVKLAGTISLPNGKGPFPAVLLIAASGPEGRDEEVEGHHVFVVLADYLLRHGIAVLRYDKRGVGASSGDLS